MHTLQSADTHHVNDHIYSAEVFIKTSTINPTKRHLRKWALHLPACGNRIVASRFLLSYSDAFAGFWRSVCTFTDSSTHQQSANLKIVFISVIKCSVLFCPRCSRFDFIIDVFFWLNASCCDLSVYTMAFNQLPGLSVTCPPSLPISLSSTTTTTTIMIQIQTETIYSMHL